MYMWLIYLVKVDVTIIDITGIDLCEQNSVKASG